ncbi:VOC family protein [Sediminibacillus halophilus]|uniref:Glyoxalase/Bleomycin resistance protein/Dioxygenase superfamily protein n=1 Tax=Sediminibacillus halophilus TaxID=482461 RepID=A0A1G9V3R2_9BACI|nr:VOC family protein [Sediminibacillus halophilus]SDM66779.1 Glyoxalase/Bleomycin resistance protein/Dioxygenase superfamily protein [Sediminibacillus halophilus]
MQIKEVTLKTSKVEEMKDFYTNVLGFPLIDEDRDSFQIAAGSSKLVFTGRDARGEPYYHFAFSIPGTKFYEAKAWVKRKVDLNLENGEDEADFPHLSARSFYFYDPAGNIVEFIARHSITETEEEAFSTKNIVNISEVSLTVEDAIAAGEQLQEFGIKERDNEPINASSLNFIGERETGVFLLLTQPGRRWIFSNKAAAVYPLRLSLANNVQILVDEYHPFVIDNTG